MSENRADYDSPWKLAIELYFREFMSFFFPELEPELAWGKGYEFLDTELQQIVRDADLGRRWADKLVKVWLQDGTETWLLIHIEVQSQYQSDFAERMYVYNYRLRDRYSCAVASLAVLADEQYHWRPEQYEQSVLGCGLRFWFPMVKLLDYGQDWPSLEGNPNPFSTVVMAHLKAQETKGDEIRRKDWKLLLTRRLYKQGYGRDDILELYRFIDWLIELPTSLEKEFREELVKSEGDEAMRYVSTIERMAKEEVGRSLILRQLNRRLGELPESLMAQVNEMSVETLEELGEALLDFTGLEDFESWVASYPQQINDKF